MLSPGLAARVRDPQHEVNDDGQQQDDSQDGGSEAVIETSLPSHSYRLGSPMIGE